MLKRILVPVDGTAGSEKAVPYAVELAKALGSEIVVCRVVTAPAGPNTSTVSIDVARYVSRVAERIREDGLVVRTLVGTGEPALEINKAAAQWNVDAIVMATRSRQRLEKLMLGSVADAVVRDSRLPVLLISSRKRLKRSRSADEALVPSGQAQAASLRRVMLKLAVAEVRAPRSEA